MSIWDTPVIPKIATLAPGDVNREHIDSLYASLKRTVNALSAIRNDLEFMINGNLDANNIRANSITTDRLDVQGLLTALQAEIDFLVTNITVTNVLAADKAYIAELTVDQLETSDKVKRYLASDTEDVDYIRIKDQYVHFITASTDGLSAEQAKDRNGDHLYWKDAGHSAVTEEVTDWPVMQYMYQEVVKASLGFEMVDGHNIPVFSLGAGSGSGDNAKFFIRKGITGAALSYHHSSTGAVRQLELSNQGVVVKGSVGSNGLRNIYVGAVAPTEPEVHMLWIDASEQLRRWNGTSWVSLVIPPNEVYVNTMAELSSYNTGRRVVTRGFYSAGDGGGAEYMISSTQLPWSIPLGGSKYANIIKEDFVNYKMFGATLTGTRAQDTQDIKKCHRYADSIFTLDQNNAKVFHCWVKNNEGIIRVTETIYCSGNVDLSGSTIIVDDVSASWFGTYVWGQNSSEYYSYNLHPELRSSMKEGAYRLEGLEEFPENVVMHLTETHYEIRDDDGYLYDVNKGELMVHKQGGIFSTALGSDWDRAGGTLIFNEGENAFMTTELVVQYTYLTSVHREFIGCEVIFDGNPNNYCSVIWVKGHNCTVRDFTFRPKPHVLANTAFKNSMIYVWGSYKVTIKNCNGMNASGKITPEVPTPTSGYAIRAFQACDLVIEDCNIMGVWGSISVSSTKNCYMSRVTCNRIDVHDYIVNLFVNACIVYSHMFQIGYGSGSCVISDSVFYYQHIPEERYPTPYLFALQTGYGRIFNGKIAIQNCKMIFLTKDTPKEFSLIWARFRPDARSVERKYRFPDITIRDFSIDTVTPDALNIIVCDFRGQTKNNTSDIIPPITNHIAFSGTTKWQRVIGTRNFSVGVYYFDGELIRKMERYLDSKGKTVFHSIEYYYVLSDDKMVLDDSGAIRAIRLLPVLDPDTGEPILDPETEQPIMEEQIVEDEDVVARIYAPYFMPGAEYSTTLNQNFVVAIGSKFFPEEVFTGNTGSKAAGDFPTHKSGVVWYGDAYGDGFFLEHIEDNITVPDWRPFMSLGTGQYFTIETKVFQCMSGGTTGGQLLEDVEWLSTRSWGSASVKYIGSLWMPGTWAPETGVILVYSNPGNNSSNFKYNRYRVVQKDGRVLGDNLMSVSGIMLDGGITWERTNQNPSSSWSPNTSYAEGAIVSINGVAHRAISTSVMSMPKRLTFSNIVHTSLMNPYLFNFELGTSVKINGQTKVVIDTMDEYSGLSVGNRPFFGLSNNPRPTYATIENPYLDNEIIYQTYSFVIGAQRWSVQNVNKSVPNIQIGRLEIINNNSFPVEYNLYEAYGNGSFAWTALKVITVPAGDGRTEYVQLSGTRNDFVAQTRDGSSALIDAPSSIVRLIFSNRTNNQTPTIISP